MSIDEKLDAVLVELRKTNVLLAAMAAAHDQGVSRDGQIVTHLRVGYDTDMVKRLVGEQATAALDRLAESLQAQRG